MTELEQLSKRIEQLAVAIKTGNAAIKSMETALKAAQEERNKFLEQEPKFERVEENEEYYFVDFGTYRENRGFFVNSDTEQGHPLDTAMYNSENYFYTEQRAQEVADKLNFLLKLERLHDIYCPNYVPDWNDDELKYFVSYSSMDKCYGVNSRVYSDCKTNVFFATFEIAQKVCNILNKELEGKI